jgi:ABC-2 type transport system ATP-binding protein
MAAGRIAAVGTLSEIRELLDDQPHSIRIRCAQAALLVGRLLEWEEVVGLDRDGPALVVRARNPRCFFQRFGQLVIEEDLDVRHLETLDESTQDVLGYLLRKR